MVIAGIGITPATSLAEGAGLTVENGIAVDAQGRTSDPDIWAAGDCACFPYKGDRIRLESVQNAIDQAEAVAKNILGAGEDYVPQPWFWSEFNTTLANYRSPGLNTSLRRGGDSATAASAPVAFGVMRRDACWPLTRLNDPRGYMTGKRLIEGGQVAGGPDGGRPRSRSDAAWLKGEVLRHRCGRLRGKKWPPRARGDCRGASAPDGVTGCARACSTCHHQLAAWRPDHRAACWNLFAVAPARCGLRR